MIEVREALKRLCDESPPLEAVATSLDEAHGRVLAEKVVADRDFPPTDRSAMDGFAVRAADIAEGGDVLEVVGELRAGASPGELKVGPGQAVRIMTGSVIPPGADAVVMVEHTREEGDASRVKIDDRPSRGQHIRPCGEEVKRGEVVLTPGTGIHAPEIAVLASVGRTHPRVHRLPVVQVLSTGDEIVEPHETPLGHQLRNSNARTLLAQLRELGLEGRYLGIAKDDPDALGPLLEQGLSDDVLVLTGGVSAGKYDLVGEALAAKGMRVLFHKVAVKPGKPILAGRRGDCLVVGLPGNPVSTYAGFAVFLAPALRRMMGYREWGNLELPAVLERPLGATPKRRTYQLARITATREGLSARPVRSRGSGDVISLSRANGFVVTDVGSGALEKGNVVPCLLWKDFHRRS